MAGQKGMEPARRKRINRMKRTLLILAVILVLASVILNIALLIRVIHLTQQVDQLYGLLVWIP